ncbi:MAG: hypothetical protein GY806_10345 [Gammaproteobacteria bacterium]|nr:hypothetical protein [Gammaproteobacteria bacterium]
MIDMKDFDKRFIETIHNEIRRLLYNLFPRTANMTRAAKVGIIGLASQMRSSLSGD